MRMIRRFLFLPVCLLAVIGSPAARAQDCPDFGAGHQLPILDRVQLARQTQILCNSGFAVLYSGVAREPLWAAEHLDATTVRAAMATPREGDFHPDTRLPPGSRAELADYVRSGFDRGHMAPSGDMPDRQTQAESFALSNIVPQRAELNRGRWAEIESAVRRLALREGGLYVVTGPAFHARTIATIGPDRVMVPTSTWKAVYDPRRQQTGVYVCHNVPRSPRCSYVSVARLTRITGVDPFPALPAGMKQTCMTLPFGHTGRKRHSRHARPVW